MRNVRFRFYVCDSETYGLTVYDSRTRFPAWSYGAVYDMLPAAALALCFKLNTANRAGRLLEVLSEQ